MFDYAKIESGRIVGRIQQSDTLSQLAQMYGGAAKKAAVVGAGASLLGAAVLFAPGGRRRGRL